MREEHTPSNEGPFRDYTPTATPSVNKKYALYFGITIEFCPCNKSFVFANSKKLFGKVETFIFRQHHHVQPGLMCLRQATCLSFCPFTNEEFGYDY